ncbi:MAG TPA: hypothetical protein VK021_00440 [Flavobacteriaceae bacterium]|nr:hypothetical protein [Flavobacteriaceae bacterium]
MDIQTDIKWIQKELEKVDDPELISLVKHLLKSGEKYHSQTLQEYNQDIADAERDIQ